MICAVVNDFCDRHTIFLPGFGTWLSESLPTIDCVITFTGIAVGYFLPKHDRDYYVFGFGGILFLLLSATVIGSVYQNKKGHADTAEAVANFAR